MYTMIDEEMIITIFLNSFENLILAHGTCMLMRGKLEISLF